MSAYIKIKQKKPLMYFSDFFFFLQRNYKHKLAILNVGQIGLSVLDPLHGSKRDMWVLPSKACLIIIFSLFYFFLRLIKETPITNYFVE